jgi:hypothetical protein
VLIANRAADEEAARNVQRDLEQLVPCHDLDALDGRREPPRRFRPALREGRPDPPLSDRHALEPELAILVGPCALQRLRPAVESVEEARVDRDQPELVPVTGVSFWSIMRP